MLPRMDPSRWATFDCYGTLVDWRGGMRGQLSRLFCEDDADRLLERYHVLEPRIQSEEPALSYRSVMARVLAELAQETATSIPAGEEDALARSLPDWPIFPEAPAALAEARQR